MQLKSSYSSNSTCHLYDFAEESGIFGNTAKQNPLSETAKILTSLSGGDQHAAPSNFLDNK